MATALRGAGTSHHPGYTVKLALLAEEQVSLPQGLQSVRGVPVPLVCHFVARMRKDALLPGFMTHETDERSDPAPQQLQPSAKEALYLTWTTL